MRYFFLLLLWMTCIADAFILHPLVHRGAQNRHEFVQRSPSNKDSLLTTSHLDLFPTPLIEASDSWGNWAALSGLAAVSQVLGKRTWIGRLLGPPVTAMALTFCLASIGVLNPGGTEAAKALQLLTLQLATPLVLLGADLRDAANRCGPLLISFALASAATVIACVVGWKVVGWSLVQSLGAKDGLIIAAALMAKNIGGGINYIAVCNSLGASPTAVAAGLCVDNIFALIYFPATSALASGRPDVESIQRDADEWPEQKASPTVSVESLSLSIFLAAGFLWLGEIFGGTAAALPICTFLTVLFASQAPQSWLTRNGVQYTSNLLGTVCLYIFFATAGAPGLAVADSVRASMMPLTLFLLCLYSIHGSILALCHRLLASRSWTKGSLLPQRLLVASSAAIGGPATAVALAQAASWESLKVPSVLVGNIGYAIATFLGLIYVRIFSS